MKKLTLFAFIALFTITANNCYSKPTSTNLLTQLNDSLPSGGIHIIDGNSSSFGFGDANNNQNLLSAVDLKRLLEKLISKQASPADSIVGIMLMQGCNGAPAAVQIENYLNANGFRVDSHGQTIGTPFDGISIFRQGGPLGIQIIIGNISQTAVSQAAQTSQSN